MDNHRSHTYSYILQIYYSASIYQFSVSFPFALCLSMNLVVWHYILFQYVFDMVPPTADLETELERVFYKVIRWIAGAYGKKISTKAQAAFGLMVVLTQQEQSAMRLMIRVEFAASLEEK